MKSASVVNPTLRSAFASLRVGHPERILSRFFYVEYFAAFVGAALGACAMRHLLLVAARALRE